MEVYRLCCGKEIDKILFSKKFSDIGKTYSDYYSKNKLNDHDYILGVRYMHFFKNLESIYYSTLIGNDNYLCCYDIPDSLLSKYYGHGNYYYFGNDALSLEEYAIPSRKIKFKYLDSVDKILGYSQIVDDFDYENIYIKDKEKQLVKVKKIRGNL